MAVTRDTKPTTLQNFPMQANGAEMMRLAAALMTEAGLTVCAPVHDAFLIEAPATGIDEAVNHARHCLAEASQVVLGGFLLRCESQILTPIHRLVDPCQDPTWGRLRRVPGLPLASLQRVQT